MNTGEPRYVIRTAAANTFREWEIFDNMKRETIGSFKDRATQGDTVVSGYAEELVKRLNEQDSLMIAADLARRQLYARLSSLPDKEVVRQLEHYEGGRAIYLPKPDPEAAQ